MPLTCSLNVKLWEIVKQKNSARSTTSSFCPFHKDRMNNRLALCRGNPYLFAFSSTIMLYSNFQMTTLCHFSIYLLHIVINNFGYNFGCCRIVMFPQFVISSTANQKQRTTRGLSGSLWQE